MVKIAFQLLFDLINQVVVQEDQEAELCSYSQFKPLSPFHNSLKLSNTTSQFTNKL